MSLFLLFYDNLTLHNNRHSAQITVHASVADVPVSNIKDLDLNQGDTIPNPVVNICMTYNVFGVTFFA